MWFTPSSMTLCRASALCAPVMRIKTWERSYISDNSNKTYSFLFTRCFTNQRWKATKYKFFVIVLIWLPTFIQHTHIHIFSWNSLLVMFMFIKALYIHILLKVITSYLFNMWLFAVLFVVKLNINKYILLKYISEPILSLFFTYVMEMNQYFSSNLNTFLQKYLYFYLNTACEYFCHLCH